MLGPVGRVQGAAAAESRPEPRGLPRPPPDRLSRNTVTDTARVAGALPVRVPESPLESHSRRAVERGRARGPVAADQAAARRPAGAGPVRGQFASGFARTDD